MPMQINSLLLSLAVPAAVKTIDLAASAVQSLGETFSQTLARPHLKELDPPTSRVDALAENLEGFAERFRRFLASHGVQGQFKLRLSVDELGEPSTSLSAVETTAVANLLSENPSWLNELKQLANNAQAARLPSGIARPAEIHIEISDRASSYWSQL